MYAAPLILPKDMPKQKAKVTQKKKAATSRAGAAKAKTRPKTAAAKTGAAAKPKARAKVAAKRGQRVAR